MRISKGERIGPYEIVALAGAGGMGEVYRARDSRMGRDVALKVLPASFAGNRDRMQRFEQEARAAGMLNHPNLLTVYDVGSHQDSPYIAAEFLEGETLREKLEVGRALRPGDFAAAIPVRKALEWSRQLASGLAAAHDKGIVHRDLKPENIFITRDGRLKILDFGLAKLTAESDTAAVTDAHTQQRGTDPGTVLGTAGYMSPEQVRGQPVDHRSDIFSFGAVLYEMLSGGRAFRGDSSADTMSAILREDPPEIAVVNPRVPPGVDRILRHCLEKNPEERFQSARDLSFDLASLSSDSGPAKPITAIRRVRMISAAFIATASLLVGLAIGLLIAQGKHPKPLAPARIQLLTFSGRDGFPAVSPDKRSIAFVSERDGLRRVWLKDLATGAEVPITTGSDSNPRFSPDGSTLIFVRNENGAHSLYRTPVVGGTARRLFPGVNSADFTPDGKHIIYDEFIERNGDRGSAIGVAATDGSSATIIGRPARGLTSPRCSPDGKWIGLIDATPSNTGSPAWLMSIDGKTIRALPLKKGLGSVVALSWVDATHILYGAAESIAGFSSSPLQQLALVDISTNEVTPLMTALGGNVVEVAGPHRLIFDGTANRQNLREFALDGKKPARWLSRGNGVDRQPVYSPDGRWVAFSSNRSGNLDVWTANRQSGAVVRMTDDAAEDYDPAYTPDGKHLLWSSNRSGNFEIWIAETDGSGARQLSHDGVDAENATVTRDGQWVIYGSYGAAKPGIAKIPLNGGAAVLLYRGASQVPEVSPDGKWVAFNAVAINQMTVAEIATGKTQMLARLKTRAAQTLVGRSRWAADGKAVIWVDRDENGGWTLQQQAFSPGRDTASTRRTLLAAEAPSFIESFAVSPDGKQLMTSVSDQLEGIYVADNVPLPRSN